MTTLLLIFHNNWNDATYERQSCASDISLVSQIMTGRNEDNDDDDDNDDEDKDAKTTTTAMAP